MSHKYVAFLRGVNLGKRKVTKEELIDIFEKLGMEQPQTFLASGNILFETVSAPQVPLIEKALAAYFGFEIGVVLRAVSDLSTMAQDKPFGAYQSGTDTKFYVTMAAGPVGARLETLETTPGDFDLVSIKGTDFFCVAHRQADGRFGAGMDRLERLFGDLLITTRNWNTILRLLKKAGG